MIYPWQTRLDGLCTYYQQREMHRKKMHKTFIQGLQIYTSLLKTFLTDREVDFDFFIHKYGN